MSAIPTSSIDSDYGSAMPCPYLGLRDDPVTHFAWDNPSHHCHRVDPPQSIRTGHQQNYCLSGRFETCAVRNDLNPSPSPSKYRAVFESDGMSFKLRFPKISLPRVNLDSFWQPSGEVSPGRRKRIWMLASAGLLVPLLVVLVWALVINSGEGGNNQASASGQIGAAVTLPVAAVIADTATPVTPTATSSAVPSSTPTTEPTDTPTPTTDFAATEAVLALTPSPTPTPTPPLYTCKDIRAYTFNLLEGPLLSPEPGYIYRPGETAPVAIASWVLENSGSCEWTSIFLLSATSGRLLVPLVYVEDELFTPDPENGVVIASPGERVEVALNFSTSIASSIQGEWVVVIGNYQLVDQPHLVLDVVNWIIRIQPTATTRPTSRPGEPQPGVTPPSDRPTPTQPSVRP